LPLIPSWYASLNRPDFIPPESLFIPIGLITYFVLGLSLYFIWTADLQKKDTQTCLYLFIVGLTLNVIYFYVFFALKSPFVAFLTMIMLLGILLSTIFQAFRVSIPACVLLVLYLILCLIAVMANYMILVMNPGLPLIGM